MVVLLVLLTILSGFVVSYLWKRRKFNEVCKLLPGPDGLPFVGSGLDFVGVKNEDLIEILTALMAKYPSPFKFWLGPKLFIVSDNPDDVQILLNSPNASYKDEVYRFMEEPFKLGCGGLISLNGDTWRHHRKLLNPCFTMKILDSYVPIFNKCARNMSDNVAKYAASGEVFNIEKNVHACSLDMIVETSLGSQLNCQFDDDVEFMKAADSFLHVLCKRFFNFWLHPEFIFKFTKWQPIFVKSSNVMTEFCRDVLKKITKENADNKIVEEEDAPKSFIKQLFKISQSGEAFNDGAVLAETITAVLAGNETSAHAMSHTILLLAMFPDIQEKVIAEMRDVLPDQDSDITPEHLHKLVYLKQTIKEAMRLLAIVPLYCRRLTGEVVLSDGVKLPEGCNICIPAMTLHLRKDIWGEDANEFNPDHFAPDVKRHPYSFLPFSGGPRVCLGYKYAYMSMATSVAYIIRNYKVSTKLTLDTLKWDFSVTMHLVNKHMVKIEKREW